jgi:hypothetical protein
MLTKSLFIRLFIRKPCGKFELISVEQSFQIAVSFEEKTAAAGNMDVLRQLPDLILSRFEKRYLTF